MKYTFFCSSAFCVIFRCLGFFFNLMCIFEVVQRHKRFTIFVMVHIQYAYTAFFIDEYMFESSLVHFRISLYYIWKVLPLPLTVQLSHTYIFITLLQSENIF